MSGRVRWPRRIVWLLAAAGVGGVAAVRSMPPQDEFSHAEHAGLFVTCASCHAGIEEGPPGRQVTVTAEDCARCHDGTREERVDWSPDGGRATNLDFSHAEHAGELERHGEGALECADCHATGERFMEVSAARPETCASCHAHETDDHVSVGDCAACHVPLPEAEDLVATAIADFPQPASHQRADFVSMHGAGLEGDGAGLAACAVCHARESCARCHLDADRRPSVSALARDERVAGLVAGTEGEWPAPETHAAAAFVLEHGEGLDPAECATCHTAPSCATCHRDESAAWVAALPRATADTPRGARVERARPPSHDAGFATGHAVAAASRLPTCESCHAPTECADCHGRVVGTPPRQAPDATAEPDAEREPAPGRPIESHLGPPRDADPAAPRPGYHIENFVQRHGAEAFAVQTSCADCHSTEAFCRDCHERVGMTVGRRGGALGAFHDAQGSWLIGHAAAARQGLEACASCHQQTSCLRCHSAKSGLRIGPHGPGFDADRLAARSTISCGICHTADQIPPP